MGRQLTYALGITLLSIAGIVYTFVGGNEPLLGLDLQGGVSVVLEPVDTGDIDAGALDEAVDIIRSRVDGLGVAEPEITRDGRTILVQIPGVDDQARALELVGQTAELRFRPVILSSPVLEGETTPEATAAEPSVLDLETPTGGTERLTLGPAPLILDQVSNPGKRLIGDALESATAQFNGSQGWIVAPTFHSGSPGIDDFNNLATQCFNRTIECPSGRIAIEIDGEVASAPNVQTSNFERSGITISGSFDEASARDLALVLRFGALPLELEAQQSRVVSSTLGSDALKAGMISGLIGLVLVAIYLVAYYRLMGIVAILSLIVSGSMLWTIISYLGSTQGLALTLAGVTGLIVSVGLSVDSNVVYFENLKEDVRGGRTIRSAVDRAFPIAYSTIVKADVASLIAAGVLYFLTVGSVKGFALYLGLATILDLVATYFFMGPMIRLLAARTGLYDHQSRFGIPAYEEAKS